MDIENNPYEVRLGWQVDLNKPDFIGKEALTKIKAEGVEQRLRGLRIGGAPIDWYNEDFYHVLDTDSDQQIGFLSSAFYSPTVGANIGLAMMPMDQSAMGSKVKVVLPKDGKVDAEIVRVPFVDPEKKRPSQRLKTGS